MRQKTHHIYYNIIIFNVRYGPAGNHTPPRSQSRSLIPRKFPGPIQRKFHLWGFETAWTLTKIWFIFLKFH